MTVHQTINMAGSHLGPRLVHIVDQCQTGRRIIDVGCDHAQVPLTLLAFQRYACAVATDIHRAPLMKAQARMHADIEAGRWPTTVAEQIEFRQQNGVAYESLSEGDTVVIAGLGGFEMLDIWALGAKHQDAPVRLVLAPQKSLAEVMLALQTQGYTATISATAQDGRTYPVLAVEAFTFAHQTPRDVPQDRATIEQLYGLTDSALPEAFVDRQTKQLTFDIRAALREASHSGPHNASHPARQRLLTYLLQGIQRGQIDERTSDR